MTHEKLATLCTVTREKYHAMYDFMPLTLSEKDKLEDTKSLEMLIKHTYHRNFEVEMHDGMQNIMMFDTLDVLQHNNIEFNKIYKDYTTVNIGEVCASNHWYSHRVLSTERFEENLTLTQKFFMSHCSQGLYEQVLTEYDDDLIEEEEHGGPLFFIMMINALLFTTEGAAKVLQECFRKFNFQTIEGEHVKKAKQFLLSGIHRLEQVNRLPSEIFLILIKGFQTTG
jgi:hypothetical protein